MNKPPTGMSLVKPALRALLAVLVLFFSLSSRPAIRPPAAGGHLSIATSATSPNAFPLFCFSSRRYCANRLLETTGDPCPLLGAYSKSGLPFHPPLGEADGRSIVQVFPLNDTQVFYLRI